MSDTSNQDELDELLPAAALGILDGADVGRFLARIEESAKHARLLEQYRDTVAMLALALPSQPMSPTRSAQLRARLVARAQNTSGHEAGVVASPSRASRTGWTPALMSRWAGWSVAAGLAGVLLVHHGFHQPLAYGWVVGGVLALVLVAVGIYARVLWGRASALQNRLLRLERPEC